MTDVNVPLLRKTLEHIEAHPEEHNQRVWAVRTSCGTAACLAGWVVQLAGRDLDWVDGVCGPFATHVQVDEETVSIRAMAMMELGLDGTRANILFDSDNSRAQLWGLANEYTGGEIEIPEKYRA